VLVVWVSRLRTESHLQLSEMGLFLSSVAFEPGSVLLMVEVNYRSFVRKAAAGCLDRGELPRGARMGRWKRPCASKSVSGMRHQKILISFLCSGDGTYLLCTLGASRLGTQP